MATRTALRKYTTMLVLIVSVLAASCTKDPPREPALPEESVLTEEPAEEQEPAEQPEKPEIPPEEPVTGIITMTTLATEVHIRMQIKPGTDSIVIDWGDGEGSDTHVLPDGPGPYSLVAEHDYSSASEHTITVTGDSITSLGCFRNQLTALDLSHNTALEWLDCRNNQLTALNVSQNTALTYLKCFDNQLTALDVSKNTALTELYCNINQLTDLDVSCNTALKELYCSRNQLTALDVSHNTALTTLNCTKNQLTTLNITSSNISLAWLYCDDNQLTASALNDIFLLLRPRPRTKQGPIDHPFWIYIRDNPGTDNCDVSIAQAKGWHVEPPEISYTPLHTLIKIDYINKFK